MMHIQTKSFNIGVFSNWQCLKRLRFSSQDKDKIAVLVGFENAYKNCHCFASIKTTEAWTVRHCFVYQRWGQDLQPTLTYVFKFCVQCFEKHQRTLYRTVNILLEAFDKAWYMKNPPPVQVQLMKREVYCIFVFVLWVSERSLYAEPWSQTLIRGQLTLATKWFIVSCINLRQHWTN